MKKRYSFGVLIFFLCGFAVFLYQEHYSVDHWYGSFRVGDNTVISLIAVGDNVFFDSNSDGIPQNRERIGPSREINIVTDDGDEFLLRNVAVALNPNATSSDSPQLIDAYIQSNEYANLWQLGTLTMAMDRSNEETCHFLGPLSFLPLPQSFELTAGQLNQFKVSVGTVSHVQSKTTGALVCSSPPGDRTSYAFDDAERPKLKIWFGDQDKHPEELVFDGFC